MLAFWAGIINLESNDQVDTLHVVPWGNTCTCVHYVCTLHQFIMYNMCAHYISALRTVCVHITSVHYVQYVCTLHQYITYSITHICSFSVVQRKIVDIALSEGYHMLHSQNYSRVIPAALQALHHSKELYGNSDIRIVPTYMVIARAAIGVCVHVCECVCMRACVHVHIRVYVCTYVCMYVRTYMRKRETCTCLYSALLCVEILQTSRKFAVLYCVWIAE